MTRFWSSKELAGAPGMHPHLAYELRDADRTGVLSHDAANAGYMAASNDAVLPVELPIALPMNTGGVSCIVFLREPTPWEFHKLERVGLLDVGESYIFTALPRN